MLKTLSKKSSREFLKQHHLGRLGCVLKNGEPYVVPVNYLFDDQYIYIHSLPGLKISAMRANPKICLQADEINGDGFEWRSVVTHGEFEEVKDREQKLKILFEFYEKFPHFTPVEAKIESKISLQNTIVFRIKISSLTGLAEDYKGKI